MKLNQTPGTLDIEIRRGDTFNKLVTISDTDLTGYELSAGIIYKGQSLLSMTITESDLRMPCFSAFSIICSAILSFVECPGL